MAAVLDFSKDVSFGSLRFRATGDGLLLPSVDKSFRQAIPVGLEGEVAFADPYRLVAGITPYNPSSMVRSQGGFKVFDQMHRDEQVKMALELKKAAVLASGWIVESEDEGAREYLTDEFDGIPGTFASAIKEILSAFGYGYSLTEIILKEDLSGLKNLKTRKPHSFDFTQDEFGNITEIIQHTHRGEKKLNPNKFILYSYQGEFDNPYGRSDLESAYRPHWYKDASYKWLGMLLERFGIPPIYALYNSSVYTGQHVDRLKSALKHLQAATSGIIPRQNKDDIEMWAPELAGQVSSVFIPSLDRFDADIARAILVPQLLGATPEVNTGSLARSKTVFDVFLFHIEQVKAKISELITEQLISVLLALNFHGDIKASFKLLPAGEEVKADLLQAWNRLVWINVVHRNPKDEAHIRELMKFPELTEEELNEPLEPVSSLHPEQPMVPEPEGPRKQQAPNKDGQEPDQLNESMSFTERKRVKDFLDESEVKMLEDLKAIAEDLKNNVSQRLDRGEEFLAVLRTLPSKEQSLRGAMEKGLIPVLQQGMRDLRGEVKGNLTFDIGDVGIDAPIGVIEAEALRQLRERVLQLAGITSDTLLRELKLALLSSIELGDTTQAAIQRLREVFQKFLGDDGIVEAGKPITAWRLENIVRTETTAAINSGRLAAAKAPDIASSIIAFRYSAILDTRTTELCRGLDGRYFRPDDPNLERLRPPNHHMCRSIIVPVTRTKKVKAEDFIKPSEVGKALELASEGFV